MTIDPTRLIDAAQRIAQAVQDKRVPTVLACRAFLAADAAAGNLERLAQACEDAARSKVEE